MRSATWLMSMALIAGSLLFPLNTSGQSADPFEAPFARVGILGAAAAGEHMPVWIHANQRNMLGINNRSAGALRLTWTPAPLEHSGIGFAYGVDVLSRHAGHYSLYFNQLYGAIRAGAFQVRLGRIEEQTPVPDPRLSSGAFALSGNATPMPGISLSVPTYTPVPLTDGWVEVKGYLGHAWFERDRFVQQPYLHVKYGYVRVGAPSPMQVYGGLVHTVIWGGYGHPDQDHIPRSWNDFLKVFFGRDGGKGAPPLDRHAPLGSHQGYWDVGLSTTWHSFRFTAYRQFFFDDIFSFRLQTPGDGVLGLSVRSMDEQKLISGLLWEFLYTRNQSDRNNPQTLGQVSNYYNHYFYRDGYTYYGQVLGSPLLFYSKENFNPTEDMTASYNNRIVGHHVGIEGFVVEWIGYRLLASYTRNYGNYADLFEARENDHDYRFKDGLRQYHVLIESSAAVQKHLHLQVGVGFDIGEMRPDTLGLRVALYWMLSELANGDQ